MKLFFLCVVLALAIHTSEGARRVDAKAQLEKALASRSGGAHREKREARRLHIRELMEAGPETELEVSAKASTVQGTTLWKMTETFKGKEVFDSQLTVETDPSGEEILDATGSFIQDIESDTNGSPAIYSAEAVNNVLNEFKDTRSQAKDIKVELKIFTDNDGVAFPGYLIEYKVEDDDRLPRRPTAIVDGRDGSIPMKWNSMTTYCAGEGVGGNEKLGQIHYNGVDHPCLDVTQEGDVCYLENDDVRVVNMHQLKWYNITDTWYYDCKNATDGINGGYSPALDAFHIGTTAYKMFREWYAKRLLYKMPKLVIRVHFGENYPNAYWNGVNCTFGDGRNFFQPFVAIDMVGHEIGHALIEESSGLIWYREPGAVNEAFADITGEVLEHYMRDGSRDWLVGADMNRGPPGEAVRYFKDPTMNFLAIAHMDHLDEFQDPHETGGILAHAFYRIVELLGQDMRQAYQVFLHANTMYWHHMSSITSATCELMKSAYDLGRPGDIYRQAFEHVGIKICDMNDHVMGLRNNETYSRIQVSNTTRPVFTFSVPGQWAKTIFVTANSSHGDVHITLSNQTWMSAYDPDLASVLAEGHGRVTYDLTDITKNHVTITLSSASTDEWDDVSVEAGYNCVPPGQASHRIYEYMRRENCEGRVY